MVEQQSPFCGLRAEKLADTLLPPPVIVIEPRRSYAQRMAADGYAAEAALIEQTAFAQANCE